MLSPQPIRELDLPRVIDTADRSALADDNVPEHDEPDKPPSIRSRCHPDCIEGVAVRPALSFRDSREVLCENGMRDRVIKWRKNQAFRGDRRWLQQAQQHDAYRLAWGYQEPADALWDAQGVRAQQASLPYKPQPAHVPAISRSEGSRPATERTLGMTRFCKAAAKLGTPATSPAHATSSGDESCSTGSV